LGCVERYPPWQAIANGFKKNESMNLQFPQEKRQNTADMNGKVGQGFTAGDAEGVRTESWQ
jgi:hypothetical protein